MRSNLAIAGPPGIIDRRFSPLHLSPGSTGISTQPKARPGWRRRLAGWLIRAIILFVVCTAAPVLLLRWYAPPVTAFMLLNNQAQIAETRYEWLDASGLGDEPALAVMASEDQRFPDHHGLDTAAISQALADSQAGGRLRGASTISQQVAKNLFLWSGRSLLRKGLEAWFAVVIDLLLPKQRILEIYLNIVELGPGLYGVPAASRVYFQREPTQITLQQAALLAAVLPNPVQLSVAQPSAYVRQRQDWIVEQADRLRRDGWLARIGWPSP